MKIYDISIPISPSMPVYPGDPAVSIVPMSQIAKGDAANVSQLSFGDHTGTHLDPPIHFIPGGKTVDQLDLDTLYGPALVVDMSHVEKAITAKDLDRAKLSKRAVRILFRTRNAELWQQPGFQTNYVGFAWDAAQWFVERGVKLVGIDYLSAELFDASEPRTHRTLLGASIIIVEGLDLSNVKPGEYVLACLPLKIKDGDGAPVRAILIEENKRTIKRPPKKHRR
ncbi:MAG: cyclase family protein [Chloroflexi bacterium]|nr:cyclase family protein [Chloroflexota bacterium]